MTPEQQEAYDEAREDILDAVARARVGEPVTLMNLSGRGLTALPREIGQLTALTKLYLQDNRLTSVPPEIWQLTALTELALNDNQLTTIPPEIGQLTALIGLDLYSNQLTAVPPEIGQLTALKGLHLFNNQLTAVPPEIGRLTMLMELNLAMNELKALPPTIGRLAALEFLSLYDNRLTTLPSETGKLSVLTQLSIYSNQLTGLPRELGNCKRLEVLRVQDNPLPPELLKLSGGPKGHGSKLIKYLQASFRAKTSATTWRRFDEAKVLFVGAGAAGKTWLLQALQGKVPEKKGSTKGIEITREPLELPHPEGGERRLHLNCWDFGGQDYFQITHQIFFSAKAVYLLVWHPRTASDADLVSRLERIELSAGRTARVLIVSTHVDGNVPAVLGKEALRERFGDLIGGFFAVDSKAGPQGTGIAALRLAIAEAAGKLEGMDLEFPPAWHDAREAVMKRKKSTMTFQEFTAACKAHKVPADDAAQVAGIMEVQGRAVFFADAAGDDAACLPEDNLIVLDPEWLAKAAGFVIEDEPTRAHSGILQHARLKNIWKKDAQRDCPGYAQKLHGFLLWLLWKFDVAYRQDADTSLVPQLIQRNRPDDLLWTPLVRPNGRHATLICQVPHDPPSGIIPALIAAVRPLRRRGEQSDPLDRNWRDGFFLDTEHRGQAFVELQDRSLRLEVRNSYPSNLVERVLKTLEEIVRVRWPRLELDYRVPCNGVLRNGKPCPHTHKKSFLEKRRDQRIDCEVCEHPNLDPNAMLDGFDPSEQNQERLLAEIKSGQTDLVAMAHAIFMALTPDTHERGRAPCLFTILPDRGGWLKNLTHNHVRITCWCEHPDGPHPATPIGSNKPPDYVLEIPKDWLLAAAPYITWGTMLFKALIPSATRLYGDTLGTLPGMDLKGTSSLLNDFAKALPSGKLEPGGSRLESTPGLRLTPEADALRHIHDALLDQVKTNKRWGGLRPVLTKSGQLLWLCAEHAAIQQPPVQEIP